MTHETKPTPKTRPPRSHPALDGLRFCSFLAVFLHHSLQFNYDTVALDAIGTGAVHAFFVLSGFLIGGTLLRDRDKVGLTFRRKALAFYARRILRIFPAYYLVVALVALLGVAGYKAVSLHVFVLYDLFYLTNVGVFVLRHWAGTQSHLWTLSVQEQFYLLAPLFLLTLRLRPLSLGFVALWVGCGLGRAYAWGLHDKYFSVLAPMQFDCLTLGVAAAIVQAQGHFLGLGPRGVGRLGLLCAVLSVPAVLLAGPTTYVGPTHDTLAATAAAVLTQWLVCVALAAFVLALWNGRLGPLNAFLALAPLVALGRMSYGLYLYHYFWLGACLHDIPVIRYHALFDTVLAFVLTVGTAALSWRFLESPVNALKSKLA